ncbi:MAG: hypothetical protein JWN84_2498 [Nocardioides sp.]|nr:hypothetical protein [Nocardioides sp.]
MTTWRTVLAVPLLLALGCSPEGPPPAVPSAPPPTAPAWLDGLEQGPPPRVPYVVGTTHVAPDGSRTGIRREGPLVRTPPVAAFASLDDGSLLVQDDDNFEGYTTVRHVRRGRTVATWDITGLLVPSPGGTVAFGEATSSEAVPKGPTALHLFTGHEHRVQSLTYHPAVEAVVDGRVVFRARFGLPGDPQGLLVSDLVGPPQPWRRPVPTSRSAPPRRPAPPGSVVLDAVLEPSGSVLLVVAPRGRDRHRLSALVRRRSDGRFEVVAPPRPLPRQSGLTPSAYLLGVRP